MANITDTPGAFGPVLRPETTDVALGGNETNFPGRQLSELARRDRFLKDAVEGLETALLAFSEEIISVGRGGFGADNSERPAGRMPFISAPGVFGWLTSTAYGRSLLNYTNAAQTAAALNIGLGKFSFNQTSTGFSTTSSNYQNAGLGVSITPQSTASKIFLLAILSMRISRSDGSNAAAFSALFRGTIGGGTLVGASKFNANFGGSGMTNFSMNNALCVATVDSPNSAGNVNYNTAVRATNGEITFNFGADVDSFLFALEVIP